MNPRLGLRAVWGSSALRVATVYAISGAGFAAAHLLLARALPTVEYALFALVLALLNLSIPLAPAGADGVVNRRNLDVAPRLLRRALTTSAVMALAAVVAARTLYDLSPPLLVALGLGVVAGGTNYLAAAKFQSLQRFHVSVALIQGVNFMLVAAAFAAVFLGLRHAWFPLAILVPTYVLTGSWAWRRLFRERPSRPGAAESFHWKEALSYAGVSGAALLLVQLERLVIPKVLTLEELAVFGVLAAIVLAPFRVLQLGVSHTLFPQLSAASGVPARRRLLVHEAIAVAAVAALGGLAIWYLTPFVLDWILAGKYVLPPALIFAALVTGLARVCEAFTKATVTALGDTRDLHYLNVTGWGSVAIATAGAVLGAHWGVIGVVYGVAAGWFSRAVVAVFLAVPHLRHDAEAPVPAAMAVSGQSGSPDLTL